MTVGADGDAGTRRASAPEPVQISAHEATVKNLGYWTTARSFVVRASRGVVVLDLLLPEIERGEIEIRLDVERSTVKLLVPDGALIDDAGLSRVGRGHIKDWTGTAVPGGRRIRLLGELRRSEVRVHRGGVAILSLMLYRRHLGDVRRARRAGRLDYRSDVRQAQEGIVSSEDAP